MTAGPAGSLLDVLVIGGGQAGLAMGYHLAQSGRSFQILDAGAEIGEMWRSRWDLLLLFTSGRLAATSRMKVNSPRISSDGSTAAANGTKADQSWATKPRAIKVLDAVAK